MKRSEIKNVLIVDCNDSFVYNIVQLLRESEKCIFDVVNINQINLEILPQYTHILLSPGPGLPSDFPMLAKLISATYRTHSILGICLGLQAIGEYFGCRLQQLKHPLHGHDNRLIVLEYENKILKDVPPQCRIGHYHSWVIDAKSIPSSLKVTAVDNNKQIMAVQHSIFSVFGLQFHPESIITEHGKQIISNWLS